MFKFKREQEGGGGQGKLNAKQLCINKHTNKKPEEDKKIVMMKMTTAASVHTMVSKLQAVKWMSVGKGGEGGAEELNVNVLRDDES